jgi:plasmid stabilization system protein ParE
MARVVITASADADLGEIIAYLRREAGDLVARRYAAEFDALYDRLEQIPIKRHRILRRRDSCGIRLL